jgi:hypothetical protein
MTYSREGRTLAAHVHEQSSDFVQAEALILVFVVLVENLTTVISYQPHRRHSHLNKGLLSERELLLDMRGELAPLVVVATVSS